jgi:hypothetical protein
MIVGNIATLRPLFQRMLRLGSDHSAEIPSKGTPGAASNPNRSHPYKSFDQDYELGVIASKNGDNSMSTQIRGGQLSRDSLSSDNESQKQILGMSNDGYDRNKDIIVSHGVEISHS